MLYIFGNMTPDTGVRQVPVQDSEAKGREAELSRQIVALRSRIFADASNVRSGEFKLRDGATLEYQGGTEIAPDSWSMALIFSEGEQVIDATFGFQINEQSSQLEPFAHRYLPINTEVSIGLKAKGAAYAMGRDFDRLLAPLPPYAHIRGGVHTFYMERNGDETTVTDFGVESFEESSIKLYGIDAFIASTAREAEENKARTEGHAPLLSAISRLRGRINILDPNAYVESADINLKTGQQLQINGGSAEDPEFWTASISMPFGNQVVFFCFGMQYDKANYWEPIAVIAYENSTATMIEGVEAIPEIDNQLKQIFSN